ncbi:hypothetical protein E143388_07741 [Rhodococcus opacus]|nr:hypothetical protein E143388_07741 [Rhodococcus opacus]
MREEFVVEGDVDPGGARRGSDAACLRQVDIGMRVADEAADPDAEQRGQPAGTVLVRQLFKAAFGVLVEPEDMPFPERVPLRARRLADAGAAVAWSAVCWRRVFRARSLARLASPR